MRMNTKKKTGFTLKSLIVRILLFVLISTVIGVGLYSWNAKSLTGNVLPMPFGVGVAVVMSGSMEPELSIDDLIIVKRAEEYRLDDVVVYQDGRSLVVHKIIAIDEVNGTVTTKGTANNTPDEPISVTAIKGKVVKDYAVLGSVVTVLKSPIVTFLILGVAVLLLIGSYRKERKSEESDLAAIREEIEKLKQAQNGKNE